MFTTESTAQVILLEKPKEADSLIVKLPLDKELPFRIKKEGYVIDVYSPFQSEMNKKMEDARNMADSEVWKLYDALDLLEKNNEDLRAKYNEWLMIGDSLKTLHQEQIKVRDEEISLVKIERDDARDKLAAATYKNGWNAFWDGVWSIKPLAWIGLDFNLGDVKQGALMFLATYGLTAIIEGR